MEERLPKNEEAKRSIAFFTVQKARSPGEFDDHDETTSKLRVKNQQQEALTHEQKLLTEDPASPKQAFPLPGAFPNLP